MSAAIQLAIIIPAVKANYLQYTLESLCRQTDQDFHLYIGDDAGDPEIPEIVAAFEGRLKMTYKRFEFNLGGKSLAGHWNRCLSMTADEPWFWLFSDDDMMEPECVADFRKALIANETARIFKYDSVKFINDVEVVRENVFQGDIDTGGFMKAKFGYHVESYVVEYVFHRDILDLTGGFRDFPMGWCTDDLFWIQGSLYTPIVKIHGAKVFWRFSAINISGKSNSSMSSRKKLRACHSFLKILKESGILAADASFSGMAVSWYFDQFDYLKINLGYFERLFLLSKLFLVFPFEMFREVFTGKLSKEGA